MYLQSTAIKAFPLGKPRSIGSNDITSRIFYEQNVSNIIGRLIDTDGFIVSNPPDPVSGNVQNAPFVFNLGGYYFEIQSGTNILPLNENGQLTTVNASGETVSLKDTLSAAPYTSVSIYFCIKVAPVSVPSGADYPSEIVGQDSNDTYQGLTILAQKRDTDLHDRYTFALPILNGTMGPNGEWNQQVETPAVVNTSYYKFNYRSIKIDRIDGKH